MTIAARIIAFMIRYNLSRARMAKVLRTAESTFNDWLSHTKPRNPPACMGLVLDLLERSANARTIAGVHNRVAGAPRGRPFRRGNPYRYRQGKAKPASALPGSSRKVD
jgi:hypothetical protein